MNDHCDSRTLLDSFAYADLLRSTIGPDVRRALAEDVGTGDITAALIDPKEQASARVITRDPGVFCGALWVDAICSDTIDVNWYTADGQTLAANDTLLELSGRAQQLLTVERTLLNFIQLLSGTATVVRRYVDLIGDSPTRLLDTRKTIPGLRLAQKYAVHCGGGDNHRIGLFDAYLIKENHLSAAGGIAPAVQSARAAHPELVVEVEVENLAQLEEAVAAGAHIALLDNFSLDETRAAVSLVAGKIKLEASGGITEESITEIAATGVDYVSTGMTTKQINPLDLSMRFTD